MSEVKKPPKEFIFDWRGIAPDGQLISGDVRAPSQASAKLQLSRTDLSSPQLTQQDISASKAAAPILVSEELVRRGVNVDQVIDQLLDSGVQQAVAHQ